MRLLSIILFLFISCHLFAQGNSILVLERFYTGQPLYFKYHEGIGGDVISCSIYSQTIEVTLENNPSKIDPSLIHHPKNSLTTLLVEHKSNCTSDFLNPDDFRKKTIKLEKLYDKNKYLIFEGELKNKKYYNGKYILKNNSASTILSRKNGVIKDSFKLDRKEKLQPKQSTINFIEKYNYRNFQKPLLFCSKEELVNINLKLEEVFVGWKNDLELVDNICIIETKI